jgi:hypothetical protein
MAEDGKSKGRWSNEEHQRYLDGFKRYGTDFKLLEAFVQTRSELQIRTHHRSHSLKNKLKGAVAVSGVSATPNKVVRPRKRKSVAPDDDDAKKAKSATDAQSPPKEVKMDTTMTQPSLCQVSVDSNDAAIKPPPMPVSDEANPTTGEDLKPPAMPSIVPVVAESSSERPPIKVEPHMNETATATSEENEVSGKAVATKAYAMDVLRREDVQTVLAGILGFAIVVFLKKVIM